jgi:glycine/D-amino acid oxidase-like deaminating enzyme
MRLRDGFHNDRRVDTLAWRETAYQADFLRLEGAIDCDICIIGAGFAGITCAYQLVNAGMKVSVVEQNQVGWGASGRIDGTNCKLRSALVTHPKFGDLASDTLEQVLRLANQYSIKTSRIEDEYILLNPVDFLLAVANASADAGVKIYEDARVKTISGNEGRFEVITDTGKLIAKHVIMCAGAYSGDLIKETCILHRPKLIKHNTDTAIAGYASINKQVLPHIGLTKAGIYFIQGLGRYGIIDAYFCAQVICEALRGDAQKFSALKTVRHTPYFFRRFIKRL